MALYKHAHTVSIRVFQINPSMPPFKVKAWDADTASSVMQQDREISQLQATCQSSIHLPADSPPTKAKLQLGVRV